MDQGRGDDPPGPARRARAPARRAPRASRTALPPQARTGVLAQRCVGGAPVSFLPRTRGRRRPRRGAAPTRRIGESPDDASANGPWLRHGTSRPSPVSSRVLRQDALDGHTARFEGSGRVASLGLVDFCHAPTADQSEKPVGPEHRALGERSDTNDAARTVGCTH